MTGKRCKAITIRGEPCKSWAIGAGEYCYTHDPTRAVERAAARKKGGYRRQTPHQGNLANVPHQVRSLDDVLGVLDYALAEALPLENSIARGRLIVAIANAFMETIKTGELEGRILALEMALKVRLGEK